MMGLKEPGMNTTWNTIEAIAPEGITELVRGSDLRLVERVEPVVRSGDAALDCSAIQRIDAAGISALVLLHERARSAGHFFYLLNVQPHVAEVLALLGLDRIFVMPEASRGYAQRTAA
jgi:anti-anti-sigma factor